MGTVEIIGVRDARGDVYCADCTDVDAFEQGYIWSDSPGRFHCIDCGRKLVTEPRWPCGCDDPSQCVWDQLPRQTQRRTACSRIRRRPSMRAIGSAKREE